MGHNEVGVPPLAILDQLRSVPSKNLANIVLSQSDVYSSENQWIKVTLIAVDPELAVETALSVSDEKMLILALPELSRTDPDAALRFLDVYLASGLSNHNAFCAIVSRVAETDPLQALKMVAAHRPDDETRRLAHNLIYSEWVRKDPYSALNSVLKLEHGAERQALFRESIRAWSQLEPFPLLQWSELAKLTPEERNLVQELALQDLATRDPEQAMGYCDQIDSDQKRRLLPLVMRKVAKVDPLSAIKWAKTEQDDSLVDYVLEQIAITLALGVPEAVVDLARSNKTVKEIGLPSAVAKLFSVDDRTGIAELRRWEGDPIYIRLVAQVTEEWGLRDAGKCFEWVRTLDGDVRSIAMEKLFKRLSFRDAGSAMALLGSLEVEELDIVPTDVWVSTVGSLARDHPKVAVDWISRLPENARDASMLKVADTWIKRDPTNAANWLVSWPPSHNKDKAIADLVIDVRKDDPAMAVNCAQNIFDDESRLEAMERAFSSWMYTDPSAAASALGDSQLPKEMKTGILRRHEAFLDQ